MVTTADIISPVSAGAKINDKNEATHKREPEFQRWRWTPGKVYHRVLAFFAFAYALGRFATNEERYSLLDHMRSSFNDSPFGLKQRQVEVDSRKGVPLGRFVRSHGVRLLEVRDYQRETLQTGSGRRRSIWWLSRGSGTSCIPVLARLTAYAAPSLMPVFYAVYASLFTTFSIGWEATLLFLGQHAVFYATASLRSTALCYVVAALIHLQEFYLPLDPCDYMSTKYGPMPFGAAFVAFHWNVLRGLSFSVDCVQSQQRKSAGENKRRWPPYWKTLGYLMYMPMLYLGPPQVYDDFVAQSEKPKPSCTPREVTIAVARILRCGAHFLLMEIMAHFFYSSAMAEWPRMGERLDLFSLLGYALSLEFNYYVCYLFTYGFAGALAKAEGIEVPGTAPCIARLHRCSQFWRYFDRGMHLLIRRYFYEPVLGGRRTASRMLLGTAVAFTFTITWHGFDSHSAVWCALSALGVALEVVTIEIRKCTPVKKFEGRYLASPERMRMTKCLLGSPHFVLTMCACIFHLARVKVCLVICRRILTGFPFPMVPVLVVVYSGCHVALDVAEWEARAKSKRNRVAP
ncbi:protein-cysteine N-palmitoyltransferase Rasp isoform X1 [Rhipicephalus sanguineus]|uniref:protein-cysteine N-palmitoyltransferase Rasp isoform X1 n=1 Tax=Rhipicephalus sanguineus TaxID=34632 RepID=UPI0020C41A9A|nr:protein-cysteine N-palmitoyltransferase Rasp isoform X1 [Rhipicephalus sanguineus]